VESCNEVGGSRYIMGDCWGIYLHATTAITQRHCYSTETKKHCENVVVFVIEYKAFCKEVLSLSQNTSLDCLGPKRASQRNIGYSCTAVARKNDVDESASNCREAVTQNESIKSFELIEHINHNTSTTSFFFDN